MVPPLAHAERVAIARLHALLELLPTALDRHLHPAGITSFEYTLLEALAEAPEHTMRLSALASRTNATLPRLSRVVSSLEKRELVKRVPCPNDGRATNAQLTTNGALVQRDSAPLYAEGARALILDGLAQLPGDGVQHLTELSYAILSVLDPEQRLAVTAKNQAQPDACTADPALGSCAADPSPGACTADPAPGSCAADPALASSTAASQPLPEPQLCTADPEPLAEPVQCAADPAP